VHYLRGGYHHLVSSSAWFRLSSSSSLLFPERYAVAADFVAQSAISSRSFRAETRSASSSACLLVSLFFLLDLDLF
jgi:hypothetical protein